MNTPTLSYKPSFDEFLRMVLLCREEENPDGLHKHKCKGCGHIWQHENSCVNHIPAHTCQCGRREWNVFDGEGNAETKLCATIPKQKMTPEEWHQFCEAEEEREEREAK